MKLTDAQIARFCQGVSLLLRGGIFLPDGMHLLSREEEGEMGPLLVTMVRELDKGCSLSQAMTLTEAFPEHVVGMAAIGETTGRLEQALQSMAVYYDERDRTLRQIKTALTYPALILLLMLGVVAVLLIRVLPVFERVYISLGSSLTGLGAGLLSLGQLLGSSLPVLLVLLAAAAVLTLLYRFHEGFRLRVSSAFLRRLGDRGFLRKFNNARCARALALGFHSGLPLEDAVTLARDLLQDVPPAARRCGQCLEFLSSGDSLPLAMGKAELLPQSQSQLLVVGLRSGSADSVMQTIAQRMTQEAQEALEETVAKIEPAMVIVCAALVGVILLAVMLPLMDILSAIG